MGQCCEKSAQDGQRQERVVTETKVVIDGKETTKKIIVDVDLMAPKGDNALEQFEYSLPFCRMLVTTFCDNARRAEKAAGNQGFVTVESLRTQFTSAAWAGLADPQSTLVRLLHSAPFRNAEKGQQVGQINLNYFILYGLLLT